MAVSTAYVNQILPKDAARVTSPGHIVQVVQTTTNANITTTSTSFVASGFTLSITPTYSTSKVLIMLNGGNTFNDTSGREVWTQMYRNIGGAGYSLLPSPYNQIIDIQGIYGGGTGRASHSVCILDSPATTSTVTYQPYFTNNGGGTSYFNANSPVLTFTLMEVAQ